MNDFFDHIPAVLFERVAMKLKEMMLEIGFIEERRTTWGNKEVPKIFFYNFLYSRKLRFNPFDSVLLATLYFTICNITKRLL